MNDLRLSLWMRCVLLACGPMNVAGAVAFSPPFPTLRQEMGFHEPDAFFLWVLSAWIIAFGVAYFYQGWTGYANWAVLALAAWGKATFAILMLMNSLAGTLTPMAGISALPDLGLALLFVGWLWHTRPKTGSATSA